MGNRLLDYNITDYNGRILDNPLTNANFLTQFGQRNPLGYAAPTYGGGGLGGIPRQATTAQPLLSLPGGGTYRPTANAEAPRDYLARAYFDANPGLLGKSVTQQAPALPEFQTAANQIGALGRAKDSGNFFMKFLENVSKGISLASGVNGLVSGLGTLALGKGIVPAVKAGISGAGGLGKNVVAATIPRAAPILYNPVTSALSRINTAANFARPSQPRPQSVGGIPRA